MCNLLWQSDALGQYGCADPSANNYDPTASINNGSCTYSPVYYTPPERVSPLDIILKETSALQFASGSLWSLNDSDGEAAIYRIDTLSSKTIQKVIIGGATNIDWEDLAFDGTHLFIGDFGNNANGARNNLRIYKIRLDLIPDYETMPVFTIPSASVDKIDFIYNDQPLPLVAVPLNSTKYDCEAMIIDNGRIHLFTKNWIGDSTAHYVIHETSAGNKVAFKIEALKTNYLVTGADKFPGQDTIILLGYQVSGFYNHFFHILSGYHSDSLFNGNKKRIDLPGALIMGQAEGITFRNSEYGYISNERIASPVVITQKLRSFNLNDFVGPAVLALNLKSLGVTTKNALHEIRGEFNTATTHVELQIKSGNSEFVTLNIIVTDLKRYSLTSL